MNTLRQSVTAYAFAVPVALSFGVLLSGCGSDPKPESSATALSNQAAPIANPVVDPTARMARAVGDNKPGAAVNIKYDLSTKPQVGIPLEVNVVFLPTASVDSLEVTFNGMDGISLSGSLSARFSDVKSGEMYPHGFSVLPERNGVFYVTVNASTRFSGTSMARTFAIPFVVGDQGQVKPATPQKDANGRPIQPMKAEEPR